MQSLDEEAGLKAPTRIAIGMAMGLSMVSVPAVLAFDCPNTHEAALAYYDKTAKVAGAEQAKLSQGKQMLDDAMKSHQEGTTKRPSEG